MNVTPMKETDADRAVRDATHRATGAELRGFVERIERLEEQKAEIADAVKLVYAEAKATGYDTKTLRRGVKRRQQHRDEVAEADATLSLYETALDTARDAEDPS